MWLLRSLLREVPWTKFGRFLFFVFVFFSILLYPLCSSLESFLKYNHKPLIFKSFFNITKLFKSLLQLCYVVLFFQFY